MNGHENIFVDEPKVKNNLKERLGAVQIEKKIDKLIQDNGLSKTKHPFFVQAERDSKQAKPITIQVAFEIARHWEEMTKFFMFTTFRSLAKLSETLEEQDSPDMDVLTALQTGVKVISDDLTNHHKDFKEVAPLGPKGIHYIWWNNDIVQPLATKLKLSSWKDMPLRSQVHALINGMRELANEPFGFAIQLRIVEEVALYIAIAFRDIYSNVFDKGEKIFTTRKQLSWITSHIKAEVSHHSQVSDTETGMIFVANTPAQQKIFLEKIQWYIQLWHSALHDFYEMLIGK